MIIQKVNMPWKNVKCKFNDRPKDEDYCIDIHKIIQM